MTPTARQAAEFGAEWVNTNTHRLTKLDAVREVRIKDVFTSSKRREFVVARHAAFTWWRALVDDQGYPLFSFPRIAMLARPEKPYDHTSVMYGIGVFKNRFPDAAEEIRVHGLPLFCSTSLTGAAA